MPTRRPPESSVRQSLPSPSPPPSPSSVTTHTQPEAEAESSSSSTWYLHHLDSHIASSYKHVLGQPSTASYHTPAGQFASSSTVVPPTNCIWTPDEKSRFFAALSRYSRHRPDLIAQDTGKTEAEVSYYIALLDSGSEGRRRSDGAGFIAVPGDGAEAENGRGLRERRARWDGSSTWREGLAPAAREVSDKWVARENVLSDQLSTVIRERDDEAEYISQSKRRRLERNELNSTIHVDPSLTPYEKRRLLESGPHLAPLEQRWKIEDWGENLTRDKLTQLNGLMQPEWAEWYGRRVRTPSPTRVKREKSVTPSISGESDLENNNNSNNNDEMRPDTLSGQGQGQQSLKADKTAKIARERKEYAMLCAIPKKDRNPEQRKRLTVILNRKRNREEYRTKKLMNEGLTMEEIEAAGGADIIYAKREKQKDIGDINGMKRKHGIAKKKREYSLESEEEEGKEMGMMYKDEVANATLKRMGMYDYVLANGLEVFNYKELAKRIPPQDSTQSLQVQPQLSFTILRLLHAEIVFHLRHLLHQAMTIAELAYIQSPPSIIVKEDEEGDSSRSTGPEMNADHVRQALALVESPTFEEDIGQDEEEYGPAQMRRKRYEESFLPPNNVPWDILPSLSLALKPNLTDMDAEDEESIEEGSETEDEDDNLEKVLESVDEEHDRKYEQALWRAEKDTTADGGGSSGEEKTLIDLGASWLVRSSQFTGKAARKSIERSEREKEYINLLLSTGNARRQRRLDDSRRERFPTTRLKKLAAARGFAVSEAIVIDSDTEPEDELDEDEDGDELGRDEVDNSDKVEIDQESGDEDEKEDDSDYYE